MTRIAPLLFTAFFVGSAFAEETPLPVAALSRDTPVEFSTEIEPFLSKNCFACHNQTKAKAGLILETPAAILKGGESGPAVEPGKAEASLLFISAAHLEDPVMPPAKNKSNAVDLNSEQLGLLKLWIDQGAKGTSQSAPAAPKTWRRSDHEPIYTVAISADGRFAACGRGHQVHVYDLRRQSLVAELVDPNLDKAAHRDFVHSIAFGPDGTLATGGYREVKIWRLPEVAVIAEVPSPGDHTASASSPDGKWRALGLADGSIKILDLTNSSAAPAVMKDHTAAVNALTFLPDNTTLISGSTDKTLRRRSIADLAKSESITTVAEVVSVITVENGARIAFGTQDNKIRLVALSAFDLSAEPEKIEFAELSGSASILRTVKIKEVEHLISAGADANVRIWDIVSKNQMRGISVGAAVIALDLSADGTKVVVQRAGAGAARVYKLEDGGLLKDLDLDPVSAMKVADLQLDEQMHARVANFYKGEVPKAEEVVKKEREAAEKAEADLPKAKETVVAKQAEFDKRTAEKQTADEALKQLTADDPNLGKAQRTVDNAKREFEKAEVEFTVAKREVAALETNQQQSLKQAEDLSLKFEDMKSKQAAFEAKVAEIKTQRETLSKQVSEATPKIEVTGVTFSRDGSLIATAQKDGTVRLYNAADGAYLESIVTQAGISALSVNIDDQLVTRLEDGRSITWSSNRQWTLGGKIGDGQNPAVFPDRVTALAISPDGNVLASGSGVASRSGELKFWNIKSLERIAENLDAHSDTISDLDFSPAGDKIVTGSPDKFVKTFEVSSGKFVGNYESHTSNVLGVAWSHDGRLLASVSADQELKIWNQETGEQVRTINGWEQEITSVAFYSKSSEQLLTSSGDKKLRIDNQVFATTEDFQYAAAVSPDGKYIVSGGEDGVLRVWNNLRQLIMTFPSPNAKPAEEVAAAAGR
jgi:WD40 repeat protein